MFLIFPMEGARSHCVRVNSPTLWSTRLRLWLTRRRPIRQLGLFAMTRYLINEG